MEQGGGGRGERKEGERHIDTQTLSDAMFCCMERVKEL